MEALIPVIGKLQDVFAAIGYRESEVQLPQIVVVGSQSAGKSSVIEGIVGRDFLPRGIGIVTRRPLLLHLIHTPMEDPRRSHNQVTLDSDWAIFEHKRNVTFTDFNRVREEIEEETNRVIGTNKGISPQPIILKIYSHRVVNLSLIDLPGITKLPVGDQPVDIEVQIRRMIESYISNPNSLILAVTPANQDFATSEPMKLARDVDPDGNRTLAVLTKLDLMDQGTDAMEVLTGKLVPVKLGILGVVNRSQADIKEKKSIQECLRDEEKFLQKMYPTLASVNGTHYLSKTLNRLLMQHIRDCLPHLKMRVNSMILQCQSLLRKYGEPITDKSRAILQIINNFSNAYTSTIEGSGKHIETLELTGGARIHYIFHEKFSATLDKLDAMEGLSPNDILTAIRNATGHRTALFVPDIAFELLVKRQIRRLEEPSLKCVELVYDELQNIARRCGSEIEQEFQRFPRLFQRINEVLSSVLGGCLPSTKQLVSSLIYMQLAYINTKHPDFADHTMMNFLKDPSASNGLASSNYSVSEPNNEQGVVGEVNQNSQNSNSSKHGKSGKRAGPATVNFSSNADGGSTSTSSKCDSSSSKATGSSSTGFWLFSRPSKQSAAVEAENSQRQATSSSGTKSGTATTKLTPRESHDCKIIEHLIRSYYFIVQRIIQDGVPKAIILELVNKVRDNLHSELVRQLYNGSDLDELLNESDSMATGRKDAMEMLVALKKASAVISEIRETQIW